MKGGVYWFGVFGGLGLIALVTEMVRRRLLRGRHALVWSVLGAASVVIAVAPSLLQRASELMGVDVPLNLLLFTANLVSAALIIQLSVESGRTNDRLRVLAEEIALLRCQIDGSHQPAPAEASTMDPASLSLPGGA